MGAIYYNWQDPATVARFVEAWCAGGARQAAHVLHVEVRHAQRVARQLRAKGLMLPAWRRGPRRIHAPKRLCLEVDDHARAALHAAADARGCSGRVILQRLLDVLGDEPALIDALLDDGVRSHAADHRKAA